MKNFSTLFKYNLGLQICSDRKLYFHMLETFSSVINENYESTIYLNHKYTLPSSEDLRKFIDELVIMIINYENTLPLTNLKQIEKYEIHKEFEKKVDD